MTNTVLHEERLAYPAEEAARLLGVSPRTMRDWCASGEISATKIGKRWLIERTALLARLHGSGRPTSAVLRLPIR
jgi:excisionase family DNA binding protein